MELEVPELVEAALREGAAATLRGGRCDACGYTFFPPYSYGCERCGASPEHLENIDLAARGRVRAAICVHRTRDGVPEGVASIELEDGPVVRAVLAVAEPLPEPGTVVEGVVLPHRQKPERLTLRFRRA